MLDFLASGAGSSIRKRRRANELAIRGDREMMLFSQAQRSWISLSGLILLPLSSSWEESNLEGIFGSYWRILLASS